MRILILSKEAWRDEQNGGNVLSNIFRAFDADFAQIYCNECLPANDICSRYYQITDKGMLGSILGKGTAGKELRYIRPPHSESATESFSGGKKWLKSLLPVFREIVWKLGRWNEDEIVEFVRDFNPDIVFAPCYGNHYMHRLTRLVHSVARVNIISYISDDHYTNRQLRWEPWYWINHLLLRRNTREVFNHYSLVYTMTDEQKVQCERDFKANMKILCKAGEFDEMYSKHNVNRPIRIVYAGGIYLNRWKTLSLLAEAIREIDPDGHTMRLDIYTGNTLSAKMDKALNDGIVSSVHSVVSSKELKDIYHEADIALHCESFDFINRLKVRMSFSTKIVDCLDSGCAVMAICASGQAGYAYLKRNDVAICISSPTDIKPQLTHLANNPEIIVRYQHKAFEFGRKKHLASAIAQSVRTDFEKLAR